MKGSAFYAGGMRRGPGRSGGGRAATVFGSRSVIALESWSGLRAAGRGRDRTVEIVLIMTTESVQRSVRRDRFAPAFSIWPLTAIGII